MIETQEKPDLTDNDFGHDLEHWTCVCDPDIALCGANLRGAEYVEAVETADDCVVCVDLNDGPCPRCGAWRPS